MKTPQNLLLTLAAVIFALTPCVHAGDKKNNALTQQQLQQQWKLQQMQQQQQQQAAAARRANAGGGASRPWSASRGGSGRIQAGSNGVPAVSASATLGNFWSTVNGVNNSGPATINLNGQYTFRGTWTVAKTGPSHVWLNLGGVSGTLEMSGANGNVLRNIVLNGTYQGAPFAANFR